MAILDSGDDNKIGGPLFQTDEYVCLNIWVFYMINLPFKGWHMVVTFV
jgi:hypothetical protein